MKQNKNSAKKIENKSNLYIKVFLVGLVSLLLRAMTPPNVIGNSLHDDLLGVQQSLSIRNFEWLGEWNNRTLLKPPLYSIYLSITGALNVNPVLFTHALLLVCNFLLTRELLKRFTFLQQKWFIPVFTILSFNPALFSSDFSRIYRVSLAACLNTLAFILLLKLWRNHDEKEVFHEISQKKFICIKSFDPKQVFLFGFICGLMLLTRDESVWLIIPSLLFLTFLLFKSLYARKRPLKSLLLNSVLSVAIMLGTFGLSISTPLLIVSGINYQKYDYFGTNNLLHGSFASAVKIWESVEASSERMPSVPINAAQRELVYQISDVARELKPYLEGPPNTGWKVPNCSSTGICGESGGAWFPFELRDAATSAFKIDSEKDFQAIFHRIYLDIKTACEKDKLECGRPGLSVGVGPLNINDFPIILEYSLKYLRSFVNFDQAQNFEIFPNADISNELIVAWGQGTGITIPQNVDNWNQSLLKTLILPFLVFLYKGFSVIFILIFLYSILNSKLRKERGSIQNLNAIFVLLSLMLFSSIYGLISNSWGFLAYPWHYGMVGQFLFMQILIIEVFAILSKTKIVTGSQT